MCRNEWPPSHLSGEPNGKRGIWVERLPFGASHLPCHRCPAEKHLHTPCHSYAQGTRVGRGLPTPTTTHSPCLRRRGWPGAPPKGRGQLPPAPARRSDIPATLHGGVELGLRDTIASPTSVTGWRALRGQSTAPCPGIPARRLRVRTCERCYADHRLWSASCGPRREAAAASPRPVPYHRGAWPGSRGLPGGAFSRTP